MKNIKNYSAILGFILAFVLDANYGILERFIIDPFLVNIIKGLGALILAKLTNDKLETKIGGGGITNPPPKK
jgi:hypothetical protein